MMRNKPEKIDAVAALNPTARFGMVDDEIQSYEPKDEQPTEEAIAEKLIELKAEYDAQEYARNRASEYPSNGDQWDMIYKDNKNSTTTHADAVEAVKTKWPKDNSGPV